MLSAESGRPMTRGEKRVSFKIEGKTYSYLQPGWWCSLTDPDDKEGQLVDEDNRVAQMARRTAKAMAKGEKVFVPVVIRAIRERCGLTQRQAGKVFGTGEKSLKNTKAEKVSFLDQQNAYLSSQWKNRNCSDQKVKNKRLRAKMAAPLFMKPCALPKSSGYMLPCLIDVSMPQPDRRLVQPQASGLNVNGVRLRAIAFEDERRGSGALRGRRCPNRLV